MNLPLLAEMVAEGSPSRIVVGSRLGGITALELLDRTRAIGAFFLSLLAEHVVYLGQNSESFPLALLAAGSVGLPFAPVNYRLPDDRLQAILRRLTPGIVISDAEMSARIGSIDGLRMIDVGQVLKEVGGDTTELPVVDDDHIAVLLFTSGTTGEPKAATLRHRHLSSYVLSTVEFLSSDEHEAQLVSVPPYHIAGIAGVLSALFSGRRQVYLPAFDPAAWLRLVQDEAISHAMVVPTMLARLLPVIEDRRIKLPSLRHLSYGGGRMPIELVERAIRALPDVDYVNAYGLTETSSTISVLTPEQHREFVASEVPSERRRLGSVGRPLPSVQLEIRDPNGNVLAAGETGEVYVRGEQVSGEYLSGSALTADGWFPTKDAGHVDDEGYLFLEGRIDDVIVRGGENLSPGEIEDVLVAHPQVKEAAVVGITDLEWGEAVGAAVVLAPGGSVTVEELQEWVRARLRSTSVPKVIQVRDELPHSEMGKLLRRVIREDLVKTLSEPGALHHG